MTRKIADNETVVPFVARVAETVDLNSLTVRAGSPAPSDPLSGWTIGELLVHLATSEAGQLAAIAQDFAPMAMEVLADEVGALEVTIRLEEAGGHVQVLALAYGIERRLRVFAEIARRLRAAEVNQ